MIQLKAYAKLNLALDITGKRPDGYHELDGIMQSISLHDTVTIKKADDTSVEMDNVHVDLHRNTAYKAATAFAELTGIKGARIAIQKRIPSEAGLGGASADAAAVLTGLNVLYGTELNDKHLAGLCVKIGADVPFALVGGTARAKGIGEKLRRIETAKPLHFVIVKPHMGVSTAEAFRRYKKSAPLRIDTLEYALAKGDIDLYLRYAGNALGMAALSIAPEIMKAANALLAAGAKRALMSGSGSTMFAPFVTLQEAKDTAERVKGDFAYCGAVSAVNTGIEIENQETNE
jgi:4-diphosphocytidyl-2-C-methyl-D-erythritol kinase